MTLRVECYSGYKGDERPIRFELNGQTYFVDDVLEQWYGPDHTYFKVRADDGNLYVLRRATSGLGTEWSLEAYRQSVMKASGF